MGRDGGNRHLACRFSPPPQLDPAYWKTERFAVRFRPSASARYYRTPKEFGVTTHDKRFVLVRWSAYDGPHSSAPKFIDLDRASSIEAATTALAAFPGPTLNFVLADTAGRAAYVLAGEIPDDPVRARWFHSATDLARRYPMIAFARLPKVAPSRGDGVWSANNKMYGAGYPLELSPQFAPPYRAYRIAQLLLARRRYDVDYFSQMQMDALSLPERKLASAIARAVRGRDPALGDALAAWDGKMSGDSTSATVIAGLRFTLTQRHNGRMPSCRDRRRYSRVATRHRAALTGAMADRRSGSGAHASLLLASTSLTARAPRIRRRVYASRSNARLFKSPRRLGYRKLGRRRHHASARRVGRAPVGTLH